MTTKPLYIVDFSDVMWNFKKVVSDPELPTLDADQIKYTVMLMFSQIDPLKYLDYVAEEMVRHDYLFSKEDYFEATPEEAERIDRTLRNYLKKAILELGQGMYHTVKAFGLLATGSERYEVINRPLTDDTYLLKPFRPH